MLLRLFCLLTIISIQLSCEPSNRAPSAENSQALERVWNLFSPDSPPSTSARQINQQSFNRNEELGRIKRTANSNFATFYERMILAARIFAGISLRIGLHNQSIPADEVLAELLNLDHFVKLENLEKFEKTKADEFVTKLNALDFANSNDLADAEEVVLLVDEWRRAYERIDDPRNATLLKAYVAEVKSLKDDSLLDFGFFDGMGTTSFSAVAAIDSFLQNSPDPSDLVVLKNKLEKLSQCQKNTNDFLTKLKVHEILFKEDVHSAPLLQFVTLLNRMIGNPGKWQPKAVNDQMLDNIKKVSNLKVSSSEAISLVEAVVGVVQGRQTDKIHTPGLINGFTDLNSLHSETGNAWLKTAVPNFNSSFFGNALRPLISLHDKSALLKRAWTAAFTNRSIEVVNILKSIVSAKTAKIDWMSNTQTKQTGIINSPGFRDKLSEVISNVVKLRKNFFRATLMVEDLLKMDETNNLEELCRLSEKITLSAGSDTIKSNHLPDVLKEMRKFTRTTELNTALQKLQPKFKEIAKLFNDVKNLAGSIIGNLSAIDEFTRNANTQTAIDFFEKLKSTADVTEMADGVKAILSIRKIRNDSSYIRDAGEIFHVFQNSTEKVERLRGVPDFISAGDNEGIDELMQLRGIIQPSKTFGIAVNGLNNIQKVLNEEATIQSGLADGLRVEEEAEKISNNETKQAVLDGWKDFEEVLMTFQVLSGQLKDVTNMTLPANETLLEYSKLFKDLIGIRSLRIPSKEMFEALEVYKRERASNDTLEDFSAVEVALRKLSVLDTDFASFGASFKDGYLAVDRIASFFNKEDSKQPGVTLITTTSPSIIANEALLQTTRRSTTNSIDKGTWEMILFFVTLVACFVVSLGLIWLAKKGLFC